LTSEKAKKGGGGGKEKIKKERKSVGQGLFLREELIQPHFFHIKEWKDGKKGKERKKKKGSHSPHCFLGDRCLEKEGKGEKGGKREGGKKEKRE